MRQDLGRHKFFGKLFILLVATLPGLFGISTRACADILTITETGTITSYSNLNYKGPSPIGQTITITIIFDRSAMANICGSLCYADQEGQGSFTLSVNGQSVTGVNLGSGVIFSAPVSNGYTGIKIIGGIGSDIVSNLTDSTVPIPNVFTSGNVNLSTLVQGSVTISDFGGGNVPLFLNATLTAQISSLTIVAAGTTFDIVSAVGFPVIFGNGVLAPIDSDALTAGGTQDLSVPADGSTALLLRINNIANPLVSFQINGTGNPAVDGQLYNAVGGGMGSESVNVQAFNGQAFAVYQAPTVYTLQPNDMTLARSLTLSGMADGQFLSQKLTVYRPAPPSLLTQVQKAQFYGLGIQLSNTAALFDAAGTLADGPSAVALDTAVTTAMNALPKIADGNDQLFGQSLEFSLGLTQFITNVKMLLKTNPISVALKADSLVFKIAAIGANALYDDPPDPNYTVVATPSALSFPPTGNAMVDGVIADYLNYLSLSAATLHAAERWQGAFFAGDTASQTLQQNAFNAYSAQAAAAQAKLTADNAALATVLQEPSLSAWPTAASDIAAAFRAQCGQPLPSDLNALLLTLTSQDEINTLVCNAVSNIQATDINFNFAPLLGVPVPPPTTLAAAVLPSSRSVGLGGTATAFATIINGGTSTAPTCSIAPVGPVPANFTYQTTNPLTNALTGTANTPIDIAAGAAQSFVIALTPTATLDPATVDFSFQCGGVAQAGLLNGVNTLLLSSSATPVPDIVALVATASNDGVLHIPGANSASAFAVATVDVGAASAITVSANTGGVTLPLALSLCQTNPTTGACLASPSPSVTATVNAGATPTFGIFGAASGAIPFDPANSRIFVQFADPGGVTRGSTSVAVATQ